MIKQYLKLRVDGISIWKARRDSIDSLWAIPARVRLPIATACLLLFMKYWKFLVHKTLVTLLFDAVTVSAVKMAILYWLVDKEQHKATYDKTIKFFAVRQNNATKHIFEIICKQNDVHVMQV